MMGQTEGGTDMRKTIFVACVVIGVAAGGLASAQEEGEEGGWYNKETWPYELTKRPLTLGKGMTEIQVEVGINASSDRFAKPISIGPDFYYGVNEQLTVGLVHATGLCLSGESSGCAKVYDDVGLEALYAVMGTGSLNFAVRGGLMVHSLSEFTMAFHIGVPIKYRSGGFAVLVAPDFMLGLTDRDAGNKEYLTLPLQLQFQATPQAGVFVETACQGPTSGFGDNYQVPVGAGVQFAAARSFDLGGRFTVGNLIKTGGGDRASIRAIEVFANLRF